MILAGDIGGTKVELALFERINGRLTPKHFEKFKSKDFTDLNSVISQFSSKHSLSIRAACFGVAGPIKNGFCRATNIPWVVEAASLSKQLNGVPVHLLNDLEANAYGIPELSSEEIFILQEGSVDAVGNLALLSPGTGLGQAGLYWDGQAHRPFATEGGHTDFAPSTELDCQFFLYLKERYGHVSWERVLSGMGTVNIYQFLRWHSQIPEPAWLAEKFAMEDMARVITEAALNDKCEICRQTIDTLVRFYGLQAGNMALTIMSHGGVYIGGGIAPKILEKLKEPLFLKSFLDKGRMSVLLEVMPVKVILNPDTALLGAARFADIHLGK